MRDDTAQRRIERAAELQVVLDDLTASPTLRNIAALHRLHAKHLREDGDPVAAERADARAEHAESAGARSDVVTQLLAGGDLDPGFAG